MSDEKDAVAEATAEVAKPKFVNSKDRFRTVKLEWPIEYDGKVYDSVTVSRMTTRQVGEFIEGKGRLVIFDVPSEVIDELDDDDAVEVNKAVEDFLPRRLRDILASNRNSGAPTSQSPQTESEGSNSTH